MFGDPARIEKLRHFLLAGRAHRLRIALHDPDVLERHEPRLLMLLRQLPASIAIHRTVGQARNATDPFVVMGNRGRLQQVMSNLLGNAVKFSHEGGTVYVRTRRHADAGRPVRNARGSGVTRHQALIGASWACVCSAARLPA